MGYTEETTPINSQPREEQQQQHQLPQQPQAFYGYPPQMPPNGFAYPGYPPNTFPYQGGASYEPVYGAPAPGFVMVPSQQLYQPVSQRTTDRVGSSLSTFVGAVLGFFFPLLSLLLLCVGVKLRMKHGVCVGHTVYYVVGVIGFVLAASLYSAQVTPYVCHDLSSCVTDVTTGIAPQYWAGYLTSCNYTNSYDSYGSDSSSSSSYEWAHGPCPLTPLDYSLAGSQTYSCASCVCDRRSAACHATKSATLFYWVVAPVCLILAIMFRLATRYYRRRIDQELLRTPYSL